MTGDEIRLTFPRDPDFFSVAHLVLGGLAVRLNLTYEELEELELAIDGLFEREDGDGDVTMALHLADGEIRTTLGPFTGDWVRAELQPSTSEEWSLRRVLDTVADRVELGEHDGGHYVALTKKIHPAPPA